MNNRSLEQVDADLEEVGATLDAVLENVENLECVQIAKLERRLSKAESSLRECLSEVQWLLDRVARLEKSR